MTTPLKNPDDGDRWWVQYAACVDSDIELFYPEQGQPAKEAKEICYRCPVRRDCLEYALANHERYGIWGGFSERERRKMELALEAV